MDILAAARQVRLLALDIDGTLTDGKIWIGNDGEIAKSFSVRDGFGITLLKKAGIQLVIITGRQSAIVERRAAELGITHVHQGVSNKLDTLKQLGAELGIGLDEMAFMGDDWPDLAAMQACALPVAPSDAVPEVLAVARWVATARAGDGALREFATFLLNSRGEFNTLLDHYRVGRPHTVPRP
ncbi:MAG: HAD-IIIA family hydrolase [Lautropia sp.]|nr:HAD-IIIA family hydrolase [Lautropia sp.]